MAGQNQTGNSTEKRDCILSQEATSGKIKGDIQEIIIDLIPEDKEPVKIGEVVIDFRYMQDKH